MITYQLNMNKVKSRNFVVNKPEDEPLWRLELAKQLVNSENIPLNLPMIISSYFAVPITSIYSYFVLFQSILHHKSPEYMSYLQFIKTLYDSMINDPVFIAASLWDKIAVLNQLLFISHPERTGIQEPFNEIEVYAAVLITQHVKQFGRENQNIIMNIIYYVKIRLTRKYEIFREYIPWLRRNSIPFNTQMYVYYFVLLGRMISPENASKDIIGDFKYYVDQLLLEDINVINTAMIHTLHVHDKCPTIPFDVLAQIQEVYCQNIPDLIMKRLTYIAEAKLGTNVPIEIPFDEGSHRTVYFHQFRDLEKAVKSELLASNIMEILQKNNHIAIYNIALHLLYQFIIKHPNDAKKAEVNSLLFSIRSRCPKSGVRYAKILFAIHLVGCYCELNEYDTAQNILTDMQQLYGDTSHTTLALKFIGRIARNTEKDESRLTEFLERFYGSSTGKLDHQLLDEMLSYVYDIIPKIGKPGPPSSSVEIAVVSLIKNWFDKYLLLPNNVKTDDIIYNFVRIFAVFKQAITYSQYSLFNLNEDHLI